MNTLVRSPIAPVVVALVLVAAALAPLLASAAAPVNISSGPSEGSTSVGPSVTFEFSSGDASSTPTFECSIAGQSDVNSFFTCSSPQTYSLPDGSYRFAVRANGDTSTLSERSFVLGTIGSSTATTTTATTTDSTATTTSAATTSSSSSSASTTTTSVPTITITSGPSDGGTVASGTVMFEFTVDNGSTTMCSLNGSAGWMCSSPQSFSHGDGSYTFSIMAGNDTGTTTVTRAFTIGSSTAATSSSSTASTTSSSTTSTVTSSSGGGGSSAPAPAPTPAPSGGGGGGNGSIAGGPPEGHSIIPTAPGAVLGVSTVGNAVIPTVPTQSNPGVTTTGTPSRAASAASTKSTVARATPATSSKVSTTGSSAVTTANIPNTGVASVTTSTTPTEDLSVAPTTSDLGAAAATADGGIPGWVWLVLAGIVLVGIGIWALRQPA